MDALIGILGFIAFITLCITQLVAGFYGIAHGLGLIWAVIAIFAALTFRFTLPITIGAFFGAMHAWGWHWSLAAMLAAPGLLFIFPGMLIAFFSAIKK